MPDVIVAGAVTWWAWCIVGLLLLGLEIFLPGAFVMWLGLSALITSGLTFVCDIPDWETQTLIFVPLSFICLFLGRRFIRKAAPQGAPVLNRRLNQYVGRIARVVEAISKGRGKIRLGDSLWLVCGPDAPVGAEVRIIRVEGSDMFVELLRQPEGAPKSQSE